MRTEQKRDVKKYFFLLPNAVFELGLHVYELAIYAYLLRIEDRRTWQCVVSYPAIADKLGISVNTVAKYVGLWRNTVSSPQSELTSSPKMDSSAMAVCVTPSCDPKRNRPLP